MERSPPIVTAGPAQTKCTHDVAAKGLTEMKASVDSDRLKNGIEDSARTIGGLAGKVTGRDDRPLFDGPQGIAVGDGRTLYVVNSSRVSVYEAINQ